MPEGSNERSPMRAIHGALDGGLKPGQVGIVVARAGVGKSTLLVHIGLEALLRDDPLLHVSLRDTVDHVRAFYDEIFGALASSRNMRDRAGALVAAERHRMIHSYLDRQFSTEHLAQNLKMLSDVAQFSPKLIVVDGFDQRSAREHLAGLKSLAESLQVPIWVTLRGAGDDAAVDGWVWQYVTAALRLMPEERVVGLQLLHPGGEAAPLPVTLDPTTMLVSGGSESPAAAALIPRPTDCTMYSGGANGAEEAFGVASEEWGVNEVNFTFDGHKQARARGRYELSPRELAAGDVSLVYVSRRLNRTYSEGSLIRRVLQTIWHMVSRSQQVFVVGEIQEDGTVKGGTGWSVELARMWNKALWVYDQDTHGWYRWDGQGWTAGLPLIESVHFSGTGTRYLTDDGKAAVRDLFERSFGRRD
jgi:hypothetical protein